LRIEALMLLIFCPYCHQSRPELEFRGAGEAHVSRPRDIASSSDEAFADYFFMRDNRKGVVFERWRHVHGCGRFFNAARHSVSDRIIATYRAGEPKPPLSEAQIAAATPSASKGGNDPSGTDP
jgi:sarcosine oxidase, subunit delta